MEHSEGTQVNELEAAHDGNQISRKARRQLRQLLLTAAVGGAMIAAPQVARAVTATGAHTTTQTFTGNNENVAADNTFTVNATVGDAVDISGNGAIVYNGQTDVLQLTTTAVTGDGLQIDSTGNQGSTPGSVTVTSAQPISGGKDGILATNAGTGGISITTSGTITGTNNDGIEVHNNNVASTGAVTVNTFGTVSGGTNGIVVTNAGLGATSVTSSGTVTGTSGDGINVLASNTANTNDVTVSTAAVSGGTNGIVVTNAGLGATSVTSSGTVIGTSGDGINVLASNTANTNDVTVSTAAVSGGTNGIVVENDGTGATSVTSSGTVTGTSGDGINVLASNTANTNDVTVSTAAVSGGTNGIVVENAGTGSTSVTSTGTVTGTANVGILAQNTNASAVDLTVNANDVSGGTSGIYATNAGTGDTSVTSTGTVTGTANDGIYASNTTNATGDLIVDAVDVTGGINGINAVNNGTGSTSVTSTGTVTGTANDGILAQNTNASAVDLTVNANDVSGGSYGIYATNFGTGDTSVTSTGTVTGTANDGIYAANTANATGDVTVNANNSTGGVYGIETSNFGSGITSITTDGIVQGGTAGIFALSSNAQPIGITVNNGSEVRNTSQNPASLAIQTVNGETSLTNNGTITGTVITDAGNDTFTNNGTWNTSGNSTFDGGNDTLTNSSTGTINTSGVTTVDFGTGDDTLNNSGAINASGTTTFSNVETVNNYDGSTINMQNGFVGDTTTFTNGGTGNFVVNDGATLLVDTNIATQQSDVLSVDNVQIGTSPMDVNVNVVAGLGQPISGNGILVVQDTSSDPNAFTMTPFTGGFYSYYLNENSIDENYYLQSALRPEAVATGVLPILGSRTALSTLSNLHDRQRDENALSNDDETRKGVWGRVFGQSNDYNSNDANDFGFNSRVWGVQAGLDLMASGDNLGNRKYAGLYVAYASASGDARQFDNKVANLDLNATTIGAYYTKYSADNWYLDLVAQYSSLGGIHAKTGTDNISPGGKSYALSLEAGKQFHPDSRIVREVQAQLIDQYTDLDSVTLNDGTHINVSGVNAVTGRFGLRLYGNPKGGKSFLPWFRANIWHTFSGDSTISSLGSSIDTPIGGTSGELELGFTKGNAQSGGWGFYGSAGYLFDIAGAEYSGWKGTLGLRKGW